MAVAFFAEIDIAGGLVLNISEAQFLLAQDIDVDQLTG